MREMIRNGGLALEPSSEGSHKEVAGGSMRGFGGEE